MEQTNERKKFMLAMNANTFDQFKKTAHALSFTMTGLINKLVLDYLNSGNAFTPEDAQALADRVTGIEGQLVAINRGITSIVKQIDQIRERFEDQPETAPTTSAG